MCSNLRNTYVCIQQSFNTNISHQFFRQQDNLYEFTLLDKNSKSNFALKAGLNVHIEEY